MKRLWLLGAVICLTMTVFAENNEIKRIPEVAPTTQSEPLFERETGFWISAELSSGYSLKSHNNVAFGEADVTLGYRFSEYFRVGPGIGIRYYFPSNKLRTNQFRWSFPLYLNFRGNFCGMSYKDLVPYYSVDLGGTVQDGFMWRPSIGVRIGQPRNAFIVSLSYMGQNLRHKTRSAFKTDHTSVNYVSFIALRVGYEF